MIYEAPISLKIQKRWRGIREAISFVEDFLGVGEEFLRTKADWWRLTIKKRKALLDHHGLITGSIILRGGKYV